VLIAILFSDEQGPQAIGYSSMSQAFSSPPEKGCYTFFSFTGKLLHALVRTGWIPVAPPRHLRVLNLPFDQSSFPLSSSHSVGGLSLRPGPGGRYGP